MRRRTALLWCVFAALGFTVLPAAPASAFLFASDFPEQRDDSPFGTPTLRSVTATCPDGEVALGGSTRVDPSLTTLGLQVARPDFTLGRFHARAARAGASTSTDWQLRGSATCFRNNGNFHPGTILCCHERAVKTVTSELGFSAGNSSATRSVTVDCGPGRTVIAGGGSISISDKGGIHSDRVALRSLTVVAGTNGRKWRARAGEVTATGRSWSLGAAAVCANVTTHSGTADYANPVYVRTGTTALDSKTVKHVDALCDSHGHAVIGGGAEVVPASGTSASHTRGIRLTISDPAPVIIAPVRKRWSASASSSSSVPRWRLRAWAVCAGFALGP